MFPWGLKMILLQGQRVLTQRAEVLGTVTWLKQIIPVIVEGRILVAEVFTIDL
jgi:hypothetical protein